MAAPCAELRGHRSATPPSGENAERVIDAYTGPYEDVLTLRAGGGAAVTGEMGTQSGKDLVLAETIAVPLTLLLLLLVFGTLISALLPLAIGVIAIAGTFAELYVLGSVTDVSVFAINLTTALGLGLGIDYALLMVNRFREQLAMGASVDDAVRRTVSTAGRTIAFSAVTVAAALAALPVLAVLLVAASPLLGITFGTPDERVLHEDAQSRQVSALLREKCDGTDDAALHVVIDKAVGEAPLKSYAVELSGLRGVARVETSAGTFTKGESSAQGPGNPALGRRDAQQISVVSALTPKSDAAQDLVATVRARLPAPLPRALRPQRERPRTGRSAGLPRPRRRRPGHGGPADPLRVNSPTFPQTPARQSNKH